MIIDLNLRGRQVVVVGGGREGTRKVEALLYQDCELHVLAERYSEKIKIWEEGGKVHLQPGKVTDGDFLNSYDRLILVMAATDDKQLNRKIVEAAKKLRCFAYAVDDPDVSDFNHPSVMNVHESVQIAISTGGKSPLMAKQLRKKLEPVLHDLISKEDVLKVQLQFRLREKVKTVLSTPDKRKQFLESVLFDTKINQLLAEENLEAAETLAMDALKNLR